MDKPPSKWLYYGNTEQPKAQGSLFSLTGRGLQYIDWLKSKGNNL